MKKTLFVLLLLALLVPMVMAQGTGRLHVVDDEQFGTSSWTHTKVFNATNGHICHPGTAIASSGNGEVGMIYRPCAAESSPSQEARFILFNQTLDEHTEVHSASVYGDNNRRSVQLRYNGENEVFYGCITEADGEGTRVFEFDIGGNWQPNFPGADGTEILLTSAGGLCSISNVVDKSEGYQLVHRASDDVWIVYFTNDNFDPVPIGVTISPNTDFQAAAPGSDKDSNFNTVWLREQPHFDSPENETQWAFQSPLDRRARIIHNLCFEWTGSPCREGGAGGASAPFVDDTRVLEYRKASSTSDNILRGSDFAQTGTGSDSLSISAWSFEFFGSTGEAPEPGEEPPRDFINFLGIDTAEWEEEVASRFALNENDELARLARLAGVGSLATEENRRIWRDPCVYADNDIILVAINSFVPANQDESVISVLGSTDGGETFGGLRPAVVGDQFAGDQFIRTNRNGNCITYDQKLDQVMVQFTVEPGDNDEGGIYLAHTNLADATKPFPEVDFTFTAGSELNGGGGTSWFGLSLAPWASGMGVTMVGLQVFLTGFLIIVFAGAFIAIMRQALLGGGIGAFLGVIFAHVAGLASLWTVFFYVVVIAAIFLLVVRFMPGLLENRSRVRREE